MPSDTSLRCIPLFKKIATKMSQKNRLLILFDVISVMNKVIALILDVFIHKNLDNM